MRGRLSQDEQMNGNEMGDSWMPGSCSFSVQKGGRGGARLRFSVDNGGLTEVYCT